MIYVYRKDISKKCQTNSQLDKSTDGVFFIRVEEAYETEMHYLTASLLFFTSLIRIEIS